MILLQANQELKQTFEKLIETMKIPVKWSGIFAVVDNYIILQGEVRSLFFHFDTRKVATNIIDIPTQEKMPHIADNMRVQNAINMILYAFGKWGRIQGLRVDKSFAQLNQLFTSILHEFEVEPEYTESYLRFYRNGMRITYEDVIQLAVEYNEGAAAGDEKEKGLWRKIVWKQERDIFERVETTLEDRRAGRIGNNFYMVGYLCPACKEKLHMVVYPVGKEFRIETEEGGVLLARACTCNGCNRFFTPRPHKLLSDGDVYTMQFEDDTRAYEDYLELLGRDGDRVSNYHDNEYVDQRADEEARSGGEEPLEELCRALEELSDLELRKITARMEEGFYPDESIRRYERQIYEQRRSRGEKRAGGSAERAIDIAWRGADTTKGVVDAAKHAAGTGERAVDVEQDAAGAGIRTEREGEEARTEGNKGVQTPEGYKHTPKLYQGTMAQTQGEAGFAGKTTRQPAENDKACDAPAEDIIVTSGEQDEARKKYEARVQMLDRYSERQLQELRGQLERERTLSSENKRVYIDKVEQKLSAVRTAQLAKRVDACEGKSYALINRMLQEVQEAKLQSQDREPFCEKLTGWKKQQAIKEVEQLVQKMPANMDRAQYKLYLQRLRDYHDVDLTPYEEKIRSGQEAAERQEIAGIVKRARKITREDYKELAGKLRDAGFLPELVQPYLEKVEERIRGMDAEEIARICPNPMQMTFTEGMEAYTKLEGADFLPELKTDVLKMLAKRLAKIKTDESELLVKKLREELAEAGIEENTRHHFYPARRVLLHQASQEETALIDFAMASYAAGRGLFEYPILVVDATRNGTGKEGIILTPDHLYYSTMLSAYGTAIDSIHRVWASTGLLNRGLYVQQKDGTKIKIPYAVDAKELLVFADVLNDFVKYLQEKPDSRNLSYLAKEKHDTICCFRCGYEYRDGNVCPKCGYQNNE